MNYLDFKPVNDGIDHINCYRKGATRLGRWLAGCTHSPFVHPNYGRFACFEGYVTWLATGKRINSLKTLHGLPISSYSRKYELTLQQENDMRKDIVDGLVCKIQQDPEMQYDLLGTNLPFVQYRVLVDGSTARMKSIVDIPRYLNQAIAVIKASNI